MYCASTVGPPVKVVRQLRAAAAAVTPATQFGARSIA
jgi:hypothetical protein